MTDVINTLTKEIEKHRLKLTELEEQRKNLELELPLVKDNLDALMRSLTIIQGKPVETDTKQVKEPLSPTIDKKDRGLREGSQSDLARLVLKEANRSLTMDELFKLASAKKPSIGYNSFSSGIYSLARKKRYFRLRSGKISLLE
jgi:hypothetical protein